MFGILLVNAEFIFGAVGENAFCANFVWSCIEMVEGRKMSRYCFDKNNGKVKANPCNKINCERNHYPTKEEAEKERDIFMKKEYPFPPKNKNS